MPELNQPGPTGQNPAQSIPNQTVDPIAPPPVPPSDAGNTSGQGSGAAVPDGVKGWGWGPFLMNWGWAIGNNVWIGLLALIPYVGFIMTIILGIKGREWAWQAKHWDSLEHFNKTQKKWAIAGVVLMVVGFIIGLLLTIVVISSLGSLDQT